MLKFIGIVVTRLLDKNTLELIEEREQRNVITRYFYNKWLSAGDGSSILTDLYVSTSNQPAVEDWPDIPNCITDGFVPAGVTSPRLYQAAGVDPAYVQVMRRFNPGGTQRSINTILLAGTSAAGTFTTAAALCYVKLAVPCIQTTSQILDVYYRVQVINDAENSYNYYAPSAHYSLKSLLGGTPVGPQYGLPNALQMIPIFSHVGPQSNEVPTIDGALFPVTSLDLSIGTHATATESSQTYYGVRKIDWSYSTAQGVGDLIGALSINKMMYANACNPCYATLNIDAPTGSKIQPIFSHVASTKTSTSANPFLDSLPSIGSGVVNFTGTWEPNLPEMYRVDIVADGNVGEATYKFSKRNHFGFIGATYTSQIVAIPGAFNIKASSFADFKKNHSANDDDCNDANGYGTRIERYDDTHYITYDQTGVARYNLVNNSIEIWDADSTPALVATNIRQVAVNPADGSIWIACGATGVYKISADGQTITNFTTADGIPSNQVWGIDVGRAGTIWAVCTGAAISYNGTTWTVYDAGTTPAFSSTIFTNDWASIHYIRVDPAHVDDRMAIVRYSECVLNTSVHFIWWSRATGTCVNATGFSNSNPVYNYFRRNPCLFNVSDNDGLWMMVGNSSHVYKCVYGTSTKTDFSVPTGPGSIFSSVMFVRDQADTQDLVLVLSEASTRFTCLFDQAGTVIYSTTPPTTTAAGTYNNYYSGVYLGHGVVVFMGSSVSFGPHGVVCQAMTIVGNGSCTASSLNYLLWDNYGWNGTAWELGNANAKLTHTDEQPMLHGLNVKFTDGTGTSFVAGDYYTGSVNDGVLKNNAMTLSGSYKFCTLPTKKLTAFDGPIRAYPWTTGVVQWRKVNSAITINVNNSLTNNIPYRSYGMSAGSKNRVFGDFSISGTLTAIASNQAYSIGVKTNNLSEIPSVRTTETNNYGINVTSNTNNAIQVMAGSSVVYQGTVVPTNGMTWNISRVGTTLTISLNGVVRYTNTTTTHSYIVNARFLDTSNGTAPITIPPVTIDSSSPGYFVGLGDSVAGTGIYDAKQYYSEILNASDIQIDGVPLVILNQSNQSAATPPVEGGASLAIEEGLLLFHANDVGKTVTGEYFIHYAVQTPCNIPPL